MQIYLQPGSIGLGSEMWKWVNLYTISPSDPLGNILLPFPVIKVAADLKSLVWKGETLLP